MKKATVLKIGAVPAILLVGVFAMQALGSTKKQANKRDATPEARAVETQLLSFGDLAIQVEGDGVIESERMLNMVSEASGRVLFARNNLKDGTFVREGEVLLKIDSRDVENDLYGLRSDFLNAVAAALPELRLDDARIYKRWFDFFNSLEISKPIPELPEITNSQEKIKISTKDIIGKYYSVRNQEIRLSKYTIRSPFDGYISSNGIIEGSFVSLGERLFTLNDAENLVVSVPLRIEESESIDFSKLPKVKIYADERSDDFKVGRITRKETLVDRNSQTLNVYVTFTNKKLNPHYLPGKYVHVSIEGRVLQDVATIPRHLLGGGYVYTMQDGKLGRRQVDVVAVQDDYAVVTNTISDETVIVTTILQKPLVGMNIRSLNMPELNPAIDLADTEDAGADAGLARDDVSAEPAAAGG
jgi:RND family efflux transporter MFP subunit